MALALSGSAARALAQLAPRRGYAAAAAASGAIRRSADGKAAGEAKEAAAAAEMSWVPDPVTGHYRPANWADVDAADLRAEHLTRSYARA